MLIKFYDVKSRKIVAVSLDKVKKTKYKRELKDGGTQVRYALRSLTEDGRPLTKFCSRSEWDQLSVPTE